MSVADCADFTSTDSHSTSVAGDRRPRPQGSAGRIRFLLDVGLEYLSLARRRGRCPVVRRNVSGWPLQIGSGLAGCCTCSMSRRSVCISVTTGASSKPLTRLRDLGNTLIVAEHDEDTIRAADWIVDIGPLAGEHGGQVVRSGQLPGPAQNRKSLTGAYLSGWTRYFGARGPAADRPQETAPVVVGARGTQSARYRGGVPARGADRGHRRVGRVSRRWSTTSWRPCWRIRSAVPGRYPAGTIG